MFKISRRWFIRSVILLAAVSSAPAADLRFAILGDRTGEAQPGVYEQIWREMAQENPGFVISVGDTIEGMKDAALTGEWGRLDQILKPFERYSLYLTPGNHDVWSKASELAFRQHARGLHYSFDYGQAHFTILDNSRSDAFTAEELAFLEADLKEHAAQPLKFVVSHRPGWITDVALQNPGFRLHQLARRYGVQYVIAGHLHQMLHFELEGVTYVSMASSGGHLRASGAYQDGWFYGHALIEVTGKRVEFHIQEAGRPHGEGRISDLADWSMLGLIHKEAAKSVPAK